MTDCKKLALAREWAEWVEWMNDNSAAAYGGTSDRSRAAADLISSLPDTIVDGDKLREILSGIENGDYDVEIGRGVSGIHADLEALLPAPPTMAKIEWDDAEHRLAEATVSELSGRPHEKVLMVEIDDFGNIRSLDPTTREMWSLSPGRLTPTGRRYRLEPEDDIPAPSIEDKPAPESASPRPGGCCGACPETVGGGVDCTCTDNPRCPNHQPRPEDVPVGEPWQVEVEGKEAIGYRKDPLKVWPWQVIYSSDEIGLHSRWSSDDEVTLVSRLVPETTETESGPACTYLDKDGDEWEYIDGGWFTADTHAKRVAKREHHCGRASLPAEYGPYTRIEDTNE